MARVSGRSSNFEDKSLDLYLKEISQVPLLIARKEALAMKSLMTERLNAFSDSAKFTFVSDDSFSAPGQAAKAIGTVSQQDQALHDMMERRCPVPHANTVVVGGLATVRANLADPKTTKHMQLFNGSIVQIDDANVSADCCSVTLLHPRPSLGNEKHVLKKHSFVPVQFYGKLYVRSQVPLLMLLLRTFHSIQGMTRPTGIAMYIDTTSATLWCRYMLYTAISRVHHIGQITLLSLHDSVFLSILNQPLPNMVHVDNWLRSKCPFSSPASALSSASYAAMRTARAGDTQCSVVCLSLWGFKLGPSY